MRTNILILLSGLMIIFACHQNPNSLKSETLKIEKERVLAPAEKFLQSEIKPITDFLHPNGYSFECGIDYLSLFPLIDLIIFIKSSSCSSSASGVP